MITKYKKFLESIKKEDMWDIIPNSVKELYKLFQASNKKLFLVGGSVRDFLTGDKPKDFDLATDATPDEVLAIIGKKWRTTVQGESFFVVVVYTEDQPMGMEIATFREERYQNRDMDNFILYIKEKKPSDYEKRIDLLLNMSKDK